MSSRILLLIMLSAACSFSLGGCASNLSQEDRDFFYSGWRNPKSRDAEAEVRPVPES